MSKTLEEILKEEDSKLENAENLEENTEDLLEAKKDDDDDKDDDSSKDDSDDEDEDDEKKKDDDKDDEDDEDDKMEETFSYTVTKEDLSEETKEHLDSLFVGEEISEEFKTKVKDIFEAAVLSTAQTVVDTKVAELSEALTKLTETTIQVAEEELEAYKTELDEKTDAYFNYVVEQWKEENKPVVESQLKAEITESFISGMKKLFVEHYIEVPDEKVDVVQELVDEIEALKEANELLEKDKFELINEKKEMVKENAIVDVLAHSDLSDVQKDKFVSLVEHLEFKNEETYKSNLEQIVERYFSKKPEAKAVVEEETPIELNEEIEVKKPRTDAEYIAEYMKQFSKYSK